MNNKKSIWTSLNPKTLYQNQIELAKLRDWPVVIATAVITIIILTVGSYLITINDSLTVHDKQVLFKNRIEILLNPSLLISTIGALGMYLSSSVQLFFYILNTSKNKKYINLVIIVLMYVASLALVFNFHYKHLNIISHDFSLFFLVLFLYFVIYLWSVSTVLFLEVINFACIALFKNFTKKNS